jgi:hypothetical protein
MPQIPLSSAPTQRLAVTLFGQACSIEVRQNGAGMYLSLWLGEKMILGARACRDRALMLTGAHYLGFAGDLMWIDNSGFDDPQWWGLADRWSLVYLDPSEAP